MGDVPVVDVHRYELTEAHAETGGRFLAVYRHRADCRDASDAAADSCEKCTFAGRSSRIATPLIPCDSFQIMTSRRPSRFESADTLPICDTRCRERSSMLPTSRT